MPRPLAYGLAVLATGLTVVVRHALDGFGPGVVPFALFYPMLLVVTVLTGVGPGLVALGASAVAVSWLWLLPDMGRATTVTTVNFVLLAVTGSLMVAAGHTLRKSLRRLAKSESRLVRAHDAGGIGSYEWRLDGSGGSQSDSMLAMIGLPQGRPHLLRDVVAPVLREDMPAVKATIAAIGSGSDRRVTEYRIRRAGDGAIRWLRDTGRVERDERGRPLRWIGIVQDVTEQMEARHALEASEAQLRAKAARLEELTASLELRVAKAVSEREIALAQLHEAQKLETIGQLSGGIAHDVNNLLTPIIASLDLLRRKLADDDRSMRLVEAALQAADRASTLISRLLAFGRRQVLQPRPTDTKALVAGLGELVRRSIGPNVRLATDLPEKLPAVVIDPNQLELAILNLAVNARDAMPDGGTLTLAARAETLRAGNAERLPPGRYVRLSVIDTGSGMDGRTLARCIEPFFTTKGIGRGTGLGLSMVHGLAEQSGGRLLMDSAPGRGTQVHMLLPASDVEVLTPAASEPVVVTVPPARVLLVDDEPLVRAGLVAMLVEQGHQVAVAESARVALALLGNDRFDVVISDLMMPGMDGAALAEAVAADWPGLPVVLISGYAEQAGPAGVPVIAKPIRAADLAAAVQAALADRAGVSAALRA